MFKGTLVTIVLGLALVNLASADTYYRKDYADVSSHEEKEAAALARNFEQLDSILEAKLPKDLDAQANLDAAKELLQNINPKNKDQKKALELVVALGDTEGKCDYESYLILAKNYVANKGVSVKNSRSSLIREHFIKRYAENCLESLKQQYHDQKENLKYLDRVEATLKHVSFRSFNCLNTRKNKLFFGKKAITTGDLGSLAKKDHKATVAIVDSVIEQALKNRHWSYLQPHLDEKNLKKVYHKASSKELKQIFNEYLFEPCAEYENVVGKTLSQARLAASSVQYSWNFLDEGKQGIFRPIINHRICRLALQEQSKLYKYLADEWDHQVKRML